MEGRDRLGAYACAYASPYAGLRQPAAPCDNEVVSAVGSGPGLEMKRAASGTRLSP